MDLSLVIPLYNEEGSLEKLYEWIVKALTDKNLTYEIIFISDGSTDSSWKIVEQLQKKSTAVRGIKFRHNYGKSPALHCGFQAAKGNVVITMDADLQDSPEEIPELYRMITEDGYDLVSGWKKKRYDSKLTKNLPSKLYNATARRVTGLKLHDMNCGLKAYKNEVVKNIEVYGEMHRYIPYLAKNAGFIHIGEKVVEHRKREFGKTKFGLSRFVYGYLDLMSVWFLHKFGKKPMHFFGAVGSVTFLLGFLSVMAVGARKLTALISGTQARLVTDIPYFYLALTAMIIGTILFLTGFLGELIVRTAPDRNIYKIEKEI